MAAHAASPIRSPLPSPLSVRSSSGLSSNSSADDDDHDNHQDGWDDDGGTHLDQAQGINPPDVLSFSFGVPHLTKRQMVHLSFEPTWSAQQSACIEFAGQGSRTSDSALPFAPLDLGTRDLKRKRTTRLLSLWMGFGLGLLASIAYSVITSRVTNLTIWVSLTTPDTTLEFHGPLVDIAEAVFDTTLFPAPHNDDQDLCRVVYLSSLDGISLCTLQHLLPEQPDIHQFCTDFSEAHSDFRHACHPGSLYPATTASITTVLSEIADGLQRLTKDHDNVEAAALSASAVRLGRRRRDAAAADLMLGTLRPWRQRHFKPLHTEIGEQERTLSIMIDRAEHISHAFDCEVKRQHLHGNASSILSRLAGFQEHLPLMRAVLDRLAASKQVLDGASCRLSTLEAGLTDTVDAHAADRSRSAVLLWFGWMPASPMLEDILSASTKLVDAANSFLHKGPGGEMFGLVH